MGSRGERYHLARFCIKAGMNNIQAASYHSIIRDSASSGFGLPPVTLFPGHVHDLMVFVGGVGMSI